jgi:putative tryptophan/tyrosine transport system substrate-binding protein
MTVQENRLRDGAGFEGAFQTIGRERGEALVVFGENLTMFHRAHIIEFATTVGHVLRPGVVDSGGLVSYGPSLTEMYRLAGVDVDKIFKGAKLADLRVEQPTEFELVIRLR